MGYHSKGIGNNKKIRAERKKPIPLELMSWFKPINKHPELTEENLVKAFEDMAKAAWKK